MDGLADQCPYLQTNKVKAVPKWRSVITKPEDFDSKNPFSVLIEYNGPMPPSAGEGDKQTFMPEWLREAHMDSSLQNN